VSSPAWYVYAIVSDDDSMTGLSAPGARDLTLVPWRNLAAVTDMATREPSRCDINAILRHNEIVEGLHRERATLPVRFGAAFRDPEAIAAAIASQYITLLADLERVGRRAEVGLTVLWKAPSALPAMLEMRHGQNGGRYLRERAAELRREDEMKERASCIARDLTGLLADDALEHRVTLAPTHDIALRAAYLLERSSVENFRQRVERIRASVSDVDVVIGEPCAPYSFVTRAEADNGKESHGHAARFAAAVAALTCRMPGLNGPGAERVN
jgi:hypothetical protein